MSDALSFLLHSTTTEFQEKMKIYIVIFCSALVAAVVCSEIVQYQHPEEWQLWKTEHRKSYESQREELERHLVWLANREYINAHNKNADLFGFTLAINHLGDITDAEYEAMYLTYKADKPHNNTKIFDPTPYGNNLPQAVDWRTMNAVTPVKQQGQCGSSYAFSATGAIEGVWALAKGALEPLSEQNIIDCSVAYGNHGCNGGDMYDSYKYIIANDGINTAKTYPYEEQQSYCQYTSGGSGAEITGFIQIFSGNEEDLQTAVAYVGPVAVAVDASSPAFRYYSGGVYSSIRCSRSSLNHAMLVTGFGTYNGLEYYLIKNSWGREWGLGGYILMSRNYYNQCGIATDASYPTL